VETVRPSVVQVRPDEAGGAGVVLQNASGLVVVTNAHVARGRPGEQIRVRTHGQVIYSARIERMVERRDLAVLRLPSHADSRLRSLSPARLGDAAGLRPGHLVIAVGHPFGLANAVTAGVVHWVGPLQAGMVPGIGPRGRSWVQADIRLAPGNSGGPLCDIEGRVVGLNTMVAAGLALAIPASELRLLLPDLAQAVPA
jgi:S1-C subfamily serine protease